MQSQERARKLRTFLAIEEQRGQELNQILNDMLPDTELPETQKSRTRRKVNVVFSVCLVLIVGHTAAGHANYLNLSSAPGNYLNHQLLLLDIN